MEYYAGLDVSLRSVAVCIVDEKGKTVLERSVPFEISDIEACLRGWPHPLKQVGFEAGAMSQHLCARDRYRLLVSCEALDMLVPEGNTCLDQHPFHLRDHGRWARDIEFGPGRIAQILRQQRCGDVTLLCGARVGIQNAV